MNEKNLTLLNEYFNQQLNAAGRARVEQLRREDANFEKEFALREEMQNWLAAASARDQLASTMPAFGEEFFLKSGNEAAANVVEVLNLDDVGKNTARPELKIAHSNVSKNWRWLAAAATLAVVAVAVWFFGKPKTENLYAEFAQHTPLEINLRSSSETEQVAADAAKYFEEKNYAAALPALEQLTAARPDDLELAIYKAICQIEIGQTEAARAVLLPIARGASAWRSEADWYLALSFLKEGDLPRCREILKTIDSKSSRLQQAQELLEKI